jgi:hypothetical protein
MRRASIGVLTLALMTPPAVTGCGGGQVTPAVATIQSEFAPHNFGPDSAVVTNRWMPWIPGTRIIHHGHFKGIPQVVDGYVTDQTRMIDGVSSRLVDDKDIDNGQLVEETSDFYAQDRQGNVWYMGEVTTHYVNGQLTDHADTWFAGERYQSQLILPGIIMFADPTSRLGGAEYQQEYAPNYAEDIGRVIGLNQSVCVPLNCYGDAMLIEEHSRLDPGILEHKWYEPGLGEIRSEITQGDPEDQNLVSYTPPGGAPTTP